MAANVALQNLQNLWTFFVVVFFHPNMCGGKYKWGVAKTRDWWEYRDRWLPSSHLGLKTKLKLEPVGNDLWKDPEGFKWDPEHFFPSEQVMHQPKYIQLIPGFIDADQKWIYIYLPPFWLRLNFYCPDLRFLIGGLKVSFRLQDRFKQLMKRLINPFWFC